MHVLYAHYPLSAAVHPFTMHLAHRLVPWTCPLLLALTLG